MPNRLSSRARFGPMPRTAVSGSCILDGALRPDRRVRDPATRPALNFRLTTGRGRGGVLATPGPPRRTTVAPQLTQVPIVAGFPVCVFADEAPLSLVSS